MASKSGRKTIFGKISSRLCRYLRVKNFVKITLSHSVSEINRFLHLTQKFKMATKSIRKTIFGKISSRLCRYLRVKNFVKITLSHSVSEINRFLRLTQKFKMAVKSGGKTIFAKKRQWTRQIPCGSKILLKSLYLTPISEINTLLCLRRNSRCPPKVAGKRFLQKVASRLCRYHAGQKFRRNRSISLHFQDKHVFALNAEIQDSRQKWLENNFCVKLPAALQKPYGSKISSKSLNLAPFLR